MHIQSTNKCLDNTWKDSENKESCCYENLSCCHIPSVVHCSFSMSQRDLKKGITMVKGMEALESPRLQFEEKDEGGG